MSDAIPSGKHGQGRRWDHDERSLSILFRSFLGPAIFYYRYKIQCRPDGPEPSCEECDGVAAALLQLPPIRLPIPKDNLELASWEEYLSSLIQ